ASGTDVDGDGLTWSYAWYINGTGSATVADTLPSSETARGDEIYVVATPNDGTEDGTPVTSATVTVVNAAPAATDVTLSPASAYTNDTLTATPAGADPDGDALTWTYAWYVDGTEVVGETGASLSGTLYFDRGQAVYVVATPSDSDAVGSSATSSTTTILNTVPTAPTVAISPSPAFESSDLICEVDTASTDADGDAISYSFSWTVDGASTSATTTTVWPDDTVLAAETTGGEEWICTATPDDGSASGATATDTITIQTWAGERIFTPCGVSGRTGPSQADCDAAYAGGTLDGEVTVATGVQTWTVPSSGDYLITAYGAQGASGDSSYVGGWGALSEGVLALTAGDVLYIAVGQEGVGQSSGSNGGGGGGSFVVDAAGTPLVVAGGGGGTRTNVSQDGCDAVASNYGVQGSSSSRTSSCSVKSSEYGLGGVVSGGSWGSGGAGFYGDGESERTTYSSWGGDGGYSWANGIEGGQGNASCGVSGDGGFGGGGSGDGCWGGGGGGGFSGGDGGRVAGGGGSYVDSSATDIVRATGYNDGEGWVVIDVAE
ncbi:MAG: hypothetical protein VX000_11230, partial [Myxococcota bacterium]|nr:hypothetical protein [Myxococcota bacterium]